MTESSTITAKGQTTVPAPIRAALGAESGTRLDWHVSPDGSILVRVKSRSILDLAGTLPSTQPPVDVDAMNAWRGE